MITSRSTLAVLETRRDDIIDLLQNTCYCVGDQTVVAARNFGFTNVRSANGDGLDLANLIMAHEKRVSHILYIGNEKYNPEPLSVLRLSGWTVIPWPAYRAHEAITLSPLLINSIKSGEIDVALFFSPHTAQIFIKLLIQERLESCCSSLTAIGLSEAITKALGSLSWKHLLSASQPTEESIFSLLLSSYPPT